jgi:hypothetical protein
LDEELKVFFESEEAKKCQIISIYTKVTHMWVAASCLGFLVHTEIILSVMKKPEIYDQKCRCHGRHCA